MARRHGITLIVTLLHCPALTEIDAGKSLLNWGFAVDGKVRPVGTLVGALKPPASAPAPSLSAAAGQRADRAQAAGSSPSVLAAAGFSCMTLLAAGVGFAYSRRQRLIARRSAVRRY
jgi:D-alanyl-D-alanine carboxypeptidase (penicillin-binding protein 5/6)